MKRFLPTILLLIILLPFSGKAQQDCSLSIQGTVKRVSCSGGMDGAIQLQVNGGAKPYAFSWSDGQEVKDVSRLTEGTYMVTVRDAKGCVKKAAFSLKPENSGALALRIDMQPVGRGKVLKAFINGQKPYAINIRKVSDGIRVPYTSYKGEVLANGIYSIEAFTEAGCSIVERVIIDAN